MKKVEIDKDEDEENMETEEEGEIVNEIQIIKIVTETETIIEEMKATIAMKGETMDPVIITREKMATVIDEMVDKRKTKS